MNKEKKNNVRSTSFNIFIPKENEKVKEQIINSIREFRADCRKIYSALALAQIAGADIIQKKYTNKNKNTGIIISGINIVVKPNTEKARLALQTFGLSSGKKEKYGSHFDIYELREFSMSGSPERYSYVSDAIRRVVLSTWKADDPEKPLSKGYLVMQGERALSKFNHIGISIPNLKPSDKFPSLEKHKIKLLWNYDIGEVEFILEKLDPGRYKIWKSLRDNISGWKLGTIYLNEHEGKLKLTISYEFPIKELKVDPDKIMKLEFTDDINNFICMSVDDKMFGADKISCYEALQWLNELLHKSTYFEKCRAAVGVGQKGKCPHTGKKNWKAIQERVNGITRQRTLGEKDRNHVWTRRIVDNAVRHDCGHIMVINIPEKQIFNHPWMWSQFKLFLEYKAVEKGIKLNFFSTAENKAA